MAKTLTIWKYELQVDGENSLRIPDGAKPLTVQVQNGVPVLWMLVDPAARYARRRFYTYGTGHPVPADGEVYVGTYQLEGGQLVFHVFDGGQLYVEE